MDELRQQLGQVHQNVMGSLNFAKTMILLRALKAGTVTLDNVVLDGENWRLLDVQIVPADAEPKQAPEG